jgi:alkylation response protein AidB-like acyl-CoA dehydrogenase
MDLGYSDEERDLRESLASFFDKESPLAAVRAAEPDGFDLGLWKKVAAMGLPSMGVSSTFGGGGASLLDLTLTAEQFGQRIAPVPLLESMVASNLLGRLVASGGDALASELLAAVIEGASLVSIALRPLRHGVAHLAPAGAIADAVLVVDGDDVVALRSSISPDFPSHVPANLGCAPLADRGRGIDERVVLASGPGARAAYGEARREWQVLMAGALVGLAQTALELGTDYVRERHAFGVPIATFQTVQHRLADAVTELEGARLLAYEAACSATDEVAEASSRAAMAFVFASQTAFTIAADSLHFHGGYGYTLEYDVQLYYRRAKAWPLAYGDPKDGYQEVAARLFERASAP